MSDKPVTTEKRRLVNLATGEVVRAGYVLEAETDAAELMERILNGESVRAAARAMGIEQARALTLYEDVLRSLAGYRQQLGQLVLEDQLQKIEKVMTRLEEKVDNGSVGASEVYLKALDQRARLLNLYPIGQETGKGAVNIQVNFNGVEPEVVEGRLVEREGR